MSTQSSTKPNHVSIDELTDAMEMQSDEMQSYYHRTTGKFVLITDEMMGQAEEEFDEAALADMSDWVREDYELVRDFEDNPEDYLEVPTKFDIHDWQIMARFCDTVTDPDMQDELQEAIHGRGAFRMFGNIVHRHGIEKDWYKFRENRYREIAKAWCKEHNLTIIPSTRP